MGFSDKVAPRSSESRMPHPAFENAAAGQAVLLGGWVTIGAEPVVEAMFSQAYDFVGIDTQHTLISPVEAARLLYARPAGGCPALVRVPSNSGPDIGKVLDAGAEGVIVPMVDTAVAACRYAPGGARSFGPMRPHLPRDVASLEARVACFVMAETQAAIDNAEEICAVPGVTGVFVGPGDLSVSLGLKSRSPMPEVLAECLRKVGVACARNGLIAAGIFQGPDMHRAIDLGFRMFVAGSDRRLISEGGARQLREIRAELAG
jgi:2-keto-3-deoxy-L-rhamnonate aldolase RhmA